MPLPSDWYLNSGMLNDFLFNHLNIVVTMKLKGKIIEVIPAKSGTTDKGDWQSQQYVLETEEEHPKRMLFEVFGESKIKEFDIKQDEVLTVSYDTKAEKRDGRWYGKNQAFAVSRD